MESAFVRAESCGTLPPVTLFTQLLVQASVFCSRLSKVCLYAAAGSLRLGPMREAIRLAWDGYLPAPADAAGLFPVERDLFERYVPARSHVLVVGSGSGRDLVGLAEMGYRVTGVEPARGAIAVCEQFLRERAVTARLIHGFFEDTDVPGPVDAITFSYFGYGLTPVSARRVAMLRKAATLLSPGGRIFISYEAGHRPPRFLTQVGRFAGIVTRSDWRIEPGDNPRLTGFTANRRGLNFEHIFTPREILDEIGAAGLVVIDHRTALDLPMVICASPVAAR
jgi:SAM-dependent methyltransferase